MDKNICQFLFQGHPILDMTVQEMEIPIKIISWISETVSSRKKVLLLSIVSMAISMEQTTGDRVSQIHVSVTTASHFSQVAMKWDSLFLQSPSNKEEVKQKPKIWPVEINWTGIEISGNFDWKCNI